MCGIAGILKAESISTDHIREMAEAMAHRGPDARGFFQSGPVHLAHLRLSILDTSERGNQPMHSPDGRYTLIHNGEIYNFEAVKAKLPAYQFHTGTDTEMILAAYDQWGPGCLQHFNGMFAFALWDNEQQELFVARDRMGIKPLYFTFQNGNLSFASEVRALLTLPWIKRKINQAAIAPFLCYQTTYTSQTLVEGVEMLGAGAYLLCKAGQLTHKTYWTPQAKAPDLDLNDRKAVLQRVRSTFSQAVERRMLSDVPLGAFLSGGIDSSAIVALMAQASSQPVKTFSVIFQEEKYDESTWSQLIADRYQTEHHPILLKPSDFLRELPAALQAMDHPSGDGINSYVVSKVTREKGITVALSGLGGDELFAGYPVFTQIPGILSSKIWKLPKGLRRLAADLYGALKKGRKAEKKQALLRLQGPEFRHLYPVYRTVYDWKLALQMSLSQGSEHPLASIVARADQQVHGLSKTSVAEMGSYTLAVLMRDMDQMSMAHALEARVPFFDHELVELCLAIPDEVKWPDYPKQLLVEAMGDLLPAEVVHRKKMGFVFPWEDWLRGEMKTYAEKRLERLKQRGVIDPDWLGRVWNEFQEGKGPWLWTHLWLPVVLEEWMENNNIEG